MFIIGPGDLASAQRGGDRQLNRALHTIALVRLRDDPETRCYAARRRAEGKSSREIRRCLKRALARQLYKAAGTLWATGCGDRQDGLTWPAGLASIPAPAG